MRFYLSNISFTVYLVPDNLENLIYSILWLLLCLAHYCYTTWKKQYVHIDGLSMYVLYLLNLQKKLTIIYKKNKIIQNYRYINDWLTVCRFIVVLHDIKGLFHFCCMLYSILWRFLSDISKVPEGIAVVSDDSMIFFIFSTNARCLHDFSIFCEFSTSATFFFLSVSDSSVILSVTVPVFTKGFSFRVRFLCDFVH